MSREEVAIVMSCLALVIKIELHPVLSRNLTRACPVVTITALEVLVIELKFKHSSKKDGTTVSAFSHAMDISIVVDP